MKRVGGYTYILTNYKRTVLYVGVSSDLRGRLVKHIQHKYKNAFTDRYNCVYLVYFETFDTIVAAIRREKQIKEWPRARKLELIRSVNPELKFYDPVTLRLPGSLG